MKSAALVERYEEIEQDNQEEMNEKKEREANTGKIYPETSTSDDVDKSTKASETPTTIDFDDYEVQKKFPSYYEYWRYRYNRSNIKKMIKGRNLTVEESDEAVNVLSLVNALILTVPFGLICNLNNVLWETAKAVDWGDCAANNNTPEERYRNVMNCMYSCAYSSMISLIIAMLYYFLRPKGKYFHEWWFRGRWCLLMVFFGTVVSIVALLTLFGSIAGIVALPYDGDTCNYLTENDGRYATAVSFLGICLVLSFVLMY